MSPYPAPVDEPLRLPVLPPPSPRPAFPLWSALAPVGGAGILSAATGSATMLWFAVLGPVLAVAGLLDGRRGSHAARRRAEREAAQRYRELRRELADRHDRERAELWTRHPDVRAHMLRPDEVWRPLPERQARLVVGSGEVPSSVRVEGGDDDEAARGMRAAARSIGGAPVVVPIEAGVAVVGPPVLARAVGRSLVLQACLNRAPGDVRVEGIEGRWGEALPQRRAGGRALLRVSEGGDAVGDDVDIPVALVAEGEPPPPRCAAVLTLLGAGRARLDYRGSSREVEIEPVSRTHAAEVAGRLAQRAATTGGRMDGAAPPLGKLLPAAPGPRRGGLPAVVGTRGGSSEVVDLVADGPHAVVIGVTGAGKSELLTTWVTSLAATHTPQQVSFLLVDYKGGRAFDPLAAVPHVAGVLTDLDESAALRAIESLRAEIRHRERVLGEVRARDIEEAGDALSRLVVVVDEYAALVATHPALHDLFGDIAARGRALGIHLVLASQRAAGVFREAVLANAPLRLALRVTDAADSRAVLGTDDAAALSGLPDDRGICLVRGPADAAPRAVRVSRCGADDLAAVAATGDAPARKPWLAPLPALIPLELVSRRPGDLVLGVADEPEHQRQQPLRLTADEPGFVVLGTSGSGRSSVVRAIARQAEAALVIPADPEAGWDAVAAAEEVASGTVVLADDLDLLLARVGPDHAVVIRDRMERLAREARARGIRVVVSAQRPGGAVARVVEALPRRFLLAHGSRADLVAAGGAAGEHGTLPPGRGHWGGTLVQALWTPEEPAAAAPPPRAWQPSRHPVALVAPATPATRTTLEAWARGGADVRTLASPAEAAAVSAPERGRVLWGTPEHWLAQWRLLGHARAAGHLIIDVACAGEYRSLTGSAELPPFALPRARRAWLRTAEGAVARIVLPG